MNGGWDLWQELASPFSVALPILFVGLAILWVSRRRRRAYRHSRDHPSVRLPSQPLERSFDLLLDARWQDAAEVLGEAVQADSTRVLEYLELGKLRRRQHDWGRAARMFEHLLARPELTSASRTIAQYELGMAYWALGLHEAAILAFEAVLRADPRHREARQALRHTHEEMGCWAKAVAIEKLRLKWGEASDYRTLAALRTQQGKAAWAEGALRDSIAHLRAALALDPDYPEAALLLGRLLLRRGKLRKAFRIWNGLARRRPELFYLAFRDMQAAFQQLQNETGWEVFLRAFTERHPDDPAGHLALAEWCESHGRPAEASIGLQRVLDIDPSCREAHLALLALYRQQDTPSEVLDTYERLVQGAATPSCGRFRCAACGHTQGELFWKCPSCHVWAPPERLIPAAPHLSMVEGLRSPALGGAQPGSAAPLVVARKTPSQTAPST